MKDSFLSANTPETSQSLRAQDNTELVAQSGMRHSIRPRRVVTEQAQKRLLEQSFVTPYESRFVTSPDAPRWQDLSIEEPGAERARSSAMPVVDQDRDSAAARAFDLLRTRLRQTTQEHGWTNIAVTAPTSGCGNTFTAVNLALSLSRIAGSRTVLMDFNMRNPGVAAAFDMQARGALVDYLDGSVAMADHMVRCGDTLALGLNNGPHAGAAETLQDPATARTLERMQAALQPELVIYDMPPMLAYDDLSAFLPQLDGVLIVSDGTQTTARQLTECERMLDGRVPLLGIVLNRARRSSVARYT
tara:strand:+ start:3083 stop:3991 length:909 start_codon:yes stop_codon:yes gene_type:complete